MSVRIFPLKNVPDDEAEEVRELLVESNIEFYETPEVFFGIFPGAIWLKNDDQLGQATQLIGNYQNKRRQQVKEDYLKLKKDGKHKTIIDKIIEDPIQFIIYIGIVLLVIYLSIMPFIDFGK